MAARVTHHVLEAIFPSITRSPTTITGAGVTQHVVEVLVANAPAARVTQHVVEVILSGDYDGSHGDPGGGGTAATTTTYGYAV